MILAQSSNANTALQRFIELQDQFRSGLNQLSKTFADGAELQRVEWLRDDGRHGGGWRYESTDTGLLNRASLNISCVHYDDLPDKRLSSATALSCIIHPQVPHLPSLHTHISWTELRNGKGGGWRLMADLNPSIPDDVDRMRFVTEIRSSLQPLGDEKVQHALEQGDRYFFIPALDRHRGVAHVYLEQYRGASFEEDTQLAQQFGETVIDTYLSILRERLMTGSVVTSADRIQQLNYHSTYFLQVLTLDRGTSSGLLVHDQNDRGILGSLPQRINTELLRSWIPRLPPIQGQLLHTILEVLPDESPCTLTPERRVKLAQTVRAFCRKNPEVLTHQARGDILPPTVAHHSDQQ